MALKSSYNNKRHIYESENEPRKIIKRESPMKENIPPLNMDSSKDCYDIDDFPKRLQTAGGGSTPKKNSHIKEEPITPHTNIKLLTALAATLDYANCATPKSRKSNESPIIEFEASDSVKTSRKEKSLALVCSRFLEIYPLDSDAGINIVSLDEATYKLGVERRRLYDIVNVFESIDMLRKQAKNRYLWFGKSNLLKALQKIKAAAAEEGIKEKLEYVLQFEESMHPSRHVCMLDDVKQFNKNLDTDECVLKDQNFITSPLPDVRKEKSLALMSQKFLMIFLVSPSKVISLSAAAKVLNGFQKEKGAQIKTQIRRLYDIANVLSSIGLIRKEVTKAANGRKPAFQYIGPDLENGGKGSTILNQSRISTNKIKPRSLSRNPSFQEICAAAEVEHQRLLQSEESKPASPFENNAPNIKDNSNNYTDLFSGIKESDENSNKPMNDIQYDYTVERRPHIISLQPSMKIINLPKNMLANNAPLYVLDCSNLYSSTNVSYSKDNAVLVPNNQANGQIKSENKEVCDQTVVLSPSQRDAILKSLNITLSPNETAVINLTGNPQSTNNNNNLSSQCNTLKIINKSNKAVTENKYSSTERLYIIQNQKVNSDYQGSNPSSSTNSTRNSSPRYDSPLSIPSGYVTPIPSASSDMTFASNSDVDSFLKKIENPASECVNKGKESPLLQNAAYFELVPQTEMKDNASLRGISEDNLKKTVGNQVLPHLMDSCSSESLNAEVSSIMKEIPLGEAAGKNKGFLIDEKTILSPIKKSDGTTAVLTPSPLMTPPYVARDKIFRFNSLINLQNSHEIKVLSAQHIQFNAKKF